MAHDMAIEESPLLKEETPIEDGKGDGGALATNGNEDSDGLAKESESNAETDKEGEIRSRAARAVASTNGYKGKYDWDSNNKKSEKASVTPPCGAIVDYAWCDGKKSVSIYVELPRLDSVEDDDLKVSLANEGEGVLFKAKNVAGKNRFLKIDKLHKKVKSAKLVRKRGKDKVIIKLDKDDEKRKWYNLKEGGGSSSYGDDDYGWNDDDDADPWIPPEDEEAVDDLLSEKTDDEKKEEGEADGVDTDDDKKGEGEAEGVDAPMVDVEETEAVRESETDTEKVAMSNE